MNARRAQLAIGLGSALAGAGAAAAAGGPAAWIAVGAVIGGALSAARAHPRAVWLVATIALLAAIPAGAELPEPVFVLVLAHAFFAGRWDEGPSSISGLLALTFAIVLNAALTGNEGVPYLFIPVAAWGAGRALGEREKVASELEVRARELEEEREAHAALSVRYERARIASELHDIVAHAITVMVVQASAGQRLVAQDPDLTADTFKAIAGAARQAEQDMGRLVALLGDEVAIGGAPDLALLDELVARAAGSGLNVTLRLEGEREGLPAELVEAAYRVVQEGLTNALRYASGSAVSVLVAAESRELVVEVHNGPAPRETTLAGAGTGNGLRGLRERVSACGGTLETGPVAGGWEIAARLPRRSPTLRG
ncbi:MAG: histidine kinase [Solirubrobacterales bacterium]